MCFHYFTVCIFSVDDFPLIRLSILILVHSNRNVCSVVTAHISLPYSLALFTHAAQTLSFNLHEISLLVRRLFNFLNFSHAHRILATDVVVEPQFPLNTSPKQQNFLTLSRYFQFPISILKSMYINSVITVSSHTHFTSENTTNCQEMTPHTGAALMHLSTPTNDRTCRANKPRQSIVMRRIHSVL